MVSRLKAFEPGSLVGPLVFVFGFVLIVVAGQVVLPGVMGEVAEQPGLYVRGVIMGLLSALLAIGLVLVYRTNRIINFAQGSLGGFAATVAQELYQVFHWPYVAAILAGVAGCVVASMGVEFLVIRRFVRAPRLILTVATIGVAQILGAFELILPFVINTNKDAEEFQGLLESPFNVSADIGGVLFTGDHVVVLVVAPAILIGLFLFLRYTRYGIAARGVAENRDRARLLGVKVRRVSLIVWAVAGLLSALTAILRAPIIGFNFGVLAGVGLLFRALAAAMIGRLESIPITVGAAVLLTLAEQTLFTFYGSGLANAFYLAVVIVALLAQRERLGRIDPGSSSWQAVQEVRPVPSVLLRVREVRWGRVGLAAVALAVAVVLPFGLSESNTGVASLLFIFGMIGISLVILTGWSGNVSLGHWAIVGFGALFVGRVGTIEPVPWDFFHALFVAACVGAAVSLAIGLPALRIRGLFLAVTTLALAVASAELFFQWDIFRSRGDIRRPVMFGLWDVTSEHAFYYVVLAFLVATLWAGRNFRRSRIGRTHVALRDNEAQAQAFGVRPVRMKLIAFGASGFVAALAGGLYAYHQQSLPAGLFPAERSLFIFSMVVIGGLGSMTGAILGAAFVMSVQLWLPAEFQLFATGFGMLLLLLVFPGGLGQILYAWRDRYLRWVADRNGILVPSLIADRRVEDELLHAQVEPGRPRVADGGEAEVSEELQALEDEEEELMITASERTR